MSKTLAPRVRGTRAVVAMLPSGRSVWLNVRPTPVPVREFDRITALIDRAANARARFLHSNAAAAQQLAGIVKSDAAKLSRMRLRENRRQLRRIAAGDAKLEGQIKLSLTPAIREARAGQQQREVLLRHSARRDLWNQLVLVSAALLMAAYGQRSDPLAENNLVIGITLGVWLFGDEISDLLAGKRSIQAGPVRGADVWSYTAPFANVLTGWWLLSDRQHERFITGTTDLPVSRLGEERAFAVVTERFPFALLLDDTKSRARTADGGLGDDSAVEQRDTYWATVDMSSLIAPEHLPDFRTFKDVPVVATIRSVEFRDDMPVERSRIELLLAEIRQESLWIIVIVSATLKGTGSSQNDPPPLLKRLEVAWAVDTREPSA